ncbi:hypothetical protein GTQ34_06630 [Muricauda sp. JGD-17]|uniref:Outer membrane protein beta-barrel domain-containing protein n=1 Tax=Flagellimonas ochracea TaxID=2696472 RepID=A0A964TB24_9FLAO|nr:outer membrane beta-barrel protein [Allomuricauda ochracea]NAY91587.1 hypothetical protein [Allomuricauda ochracea]
MGKKNLEQLFKDSFKDFERTPDERVWDSIEATLDKKKQKRRIIPFWWQLGGIAALLAILFYVINPLDTTTDGNEEIIVSDIENTDETPKIEDKTKEALPAEVKSNRDENQILTDTSDETEKRLDQTTDGSIEKESGFDSNEKLVTQTQDKKEDLNKREPSVVSAISEKNRKNALLVNNRDVFKETDQMDNTVEKIKERRSLESTSGEKALADNTDKNPSSKKSSLSDALETEKQGNEALAETEEEEETAIKRSIFEAIAEQEDEIEVVEASQDKWSVGPSVAPVYFNGNGEGSPIHSNFASNSKSGNINLSYGLTVAYTISKRLKIRSGVHRVNYGYDTNDVVFSSSLEASTDQTIDNINYSETSRTLVVQSKNEIQGKSLNDTSVELTANEVPALEGKMVQQLGYIEVPLELNYTLIDKKLGVNLIGGVSSLFLVENTVLLESQDLVTEMGKANNANSVNYSTNIGVGLNYEISPKLQFNLEPVFKYQLNTFSETAGPFRPYSVGVYSGVSLRF